MYTIKLTTIIINNNDNNDVFKNYFTKYEYNTVIVFCLMSHTKQVYYMYTFCSRGYMLLAVSSCAPRQVSTSVWSSLKSGWKIRNQINKCSTRWCVDIVKKLYEVWLKVNCGIVRSHQHSIFINFVDEQLHCLTNEGK